MKRLKKTSIPLPGYLPVSKLLIINRDALRAMTKTEKQTACKVLLHELLIWSCYSNYEAIGVLQAEQFKFILGLTDYSDDI